jgi:hypothetical protein
VTLQETVVDRPPEGLARGRWEAPRWTIAALGVAVALGALGYLFFRVRRAIRVRR